MNTASIDTHFFLLFLALVLLLRVLFRAASRTTALTREITKSLARTTGDLIRIGMQATLVTALMVVLFISLLTTISQGS